MADTLVASAYLRVEDGRLLTFDVQRWIDAADPVDERLLDRARGPVLDVGCGPGRHVEALGRRGIDALGLDISPNAVAFARRRGAQVLQRSIFDALDQGGPWRTALLLDGSVGIGGEPIALLRRIGQLLHWRRRVLVEAEPADVASESLVVRMETRRRARSLVPLGQGVGGRRGRRGCCSRLPGDGDVGGRRPALHLAGAPLPTLMKRKAGRNASSVAGKKHW